MENIICPRLATYHYDSSNAATFQIDVVKSRIQIDGMNGPREYTSSYACFKCMKAKTGWAGM